MDLLLAAETKVTEAFCTEEHSLSDQKLTQIGIVFESENSKYGASLPVLG